MSHKTFALIFGILFAAAGVLGFVPALTPNSHLFNILRVDPIHNSFHVITGVFGLLASLSAYYSRIYFKILGIVYIFLAVLGISLGGNLVLMQFNHSDNIFHLVVGAIASYLGFGKQRTN